MTQCLTALLLIFFIGALGYYFHKEARNAKNKANNDWEKSDEELDVQGELVKSDHEDFVTPEGEHLETIEPVVDVVVETPQSNIPKRRAKRNYRKSNKQKKN